jgi:SsrA-binding protein
MTDKIILQNRKARYDYHIISTLEAGVVLKGAEVKSLRSGKASISDSFIYPKGNEIFVHNFYIAEYDHISAYKLDNYRIKKLLLKRKEINKLIGTIKKAGVTIVPTKVYFNKKNFIKVEIAIVTGKKKYDKREVIKKRDWDRKKQALLKNSQHND